MSAEVVEVVVVGGGQAGLAMGAELVRRGRDVAVLEAAAEPAAAWRSRWDSLRLFTPARYSGLPGLPFPGDPDAHPGRDDVVAYLTEYARRFDVPVELSTRVGRVAPQDGALRVEAGDRVYEAAHVVVATGPFQAPRVPEAARGLDPGVASLHSGAYRRPEELPDGPVLVVGGGNTGCQIAEELAATREVHLAVGSHQLPLPQRLVGRDLFAHLDRLGLMRRTVDSRLGRRMRDRETLVGTSPRKVARRHGVRLHPRATGAAGRSVTFADGTTLDGLAAVVWATGFALDHSFVDAPAFDERGRVVHRRGVTAVPGLLFLGLPWLHTRGSALLGWVGDDAAHLADVVTSR